MSTAPVVPDAPKTETVKDAQVALKPDAVEVKQPAKDENVSDLPYHNKETEKIAASRKADPVKAYEYKGNGYTVTSRDATDQELPFAEPVDPVIAARFPDIKPLVYEVKADGGFLKVYGNKRDAEIFVETHAAAHKDTPATMPSA